MDEEAVFSFVLDSLRQLVVAEGKFLLGVNDQVREVEHELKAMRWFLTDGAGNQQGANGRALEWVIQVRDLAYEAEDVIETYAIKVKSRRGIKRMACFLKEGYVLNQIGSDIESLFKRTTSLKSIFRDYGIKEIMENKDDGGSSSEPSLRRTYSNVNPHKNLFVGMEQDINILVESIVGLEYPSVSICGMGGIGKTTLARKLYHHPRVRNHFHKFVWISISQVWQKKDLLYRISVGLFPNKKDAIEKWDDAEQVREISSIILSNKCIIILDDMWSDDAWKSIEPAIPIGTSKVIVTTRNEEVAKCIDGSYTHKPQLLSEEESWELLSNKALHYHPDDPKIHGMEKLGRKMVHHCGGLPLAIVVLGGILSSKSSYEEWEGVHKNVRSYLSKGKNIGVDEGDVPKILALSYDDLPYQLKPCFLYLSKYREDEEIDAVTLYQIWMAEGMVLSKDKNVDGETMMDVAERYLAELAERCMVFVEVEEVPMFRRFKSCRLHDLMRDLCISQAEKESFLELLVNGISPKKATCRRLSIYLTERELVDLHYEEHVSTRLRSFCFVNKSYSRLPVFIFEDFLLLRVLILERVVSFRKERGVLIDKLRLPSSIRKLIHLRYLSLKYSKFLILSSAISNLTQLETLDLTGTKISWIFNVIWKLRSLKHLYLPRYKSFQIKMASIFHLFMLRLDGLNKLEILDGFDTEYCNTKHISTLTNLRSLTARVYNNNNGLQVFINQVRKLKHLQFLSLDIFGIDDLSLVEEMFSLTWLANLFMGGSIRALPEYRDGFGKNLQEVSLDGTETDPVSTLEKLPNLRRLTLLYFEGGEMTCHANGFPKLEYLCVKACVSLEKWEIEKGAFPHLSYLEIEYCQKLKMIPDGLRFVTSLKELVLNQMAPELLRRVAGQGEDMHKISHVQKVTIS